MAPKLMNRFRVRVKTEPEDQQGDNAGSAAGAAGTTAHVSEIGDDVPISAFQQQRFALEQQQAESGPSRDATTAAAAAAATAGARLAASAGVRGSTTAQAARQAQQSAAATAHAAQVTGTTSGGGAASASVNVDELRRAAGQVATVYTEGVIPPISSVDLDRFARGIASAPSAQVKQDDVKAETADGDSGDDVQEARATHVGEEAPVDPGVGFLHEADREAQRAHTANSIFFTADGEPKKFEESAEIAWMQLPRMPAAPRLGAALPAQPQRGLLESLPSGRVGRLRVHRSGKVSLVLDDAQAGAAPPVAFDVAAERPDGMAQNLMAIEPSGDGAADLRCYDLGAVTQRLVCTPKLPDGFDDDDA